MQAGGEGRRVRCSLAGAWGLLVNPRPELPAPATQLPAIRDPRAIIQWRASSLKQRGRLEDERSRIILTDDGSYDLSVDKVGVAPPAPNPARGAGQDQKSTQDLARAFGEVVEVERRQHEDQQSESQLR